jgi:hypothetical protein
MYRKSLPHRPEGTGHDPLRFVRLDLTNGERIHRLVQVELTGREQNGAGLGASLEHRRWCQKGTSSAISGFGPVSPSFGRKVSAR